uniref:Histone-lysine N-methyltransferase SETMAR n=1 Tax=Caenorhabditis japonica TaxID=281687 RepID=A0A8R1EXG6_CAEJA
MRRNVCFPASGTRSACYTTSCSCKGERSMLLPTSINFASLALALREKRPRRSAVHLLHDNARPHVAKATQEKLQELYWNTVLHTPYSPDIAPSDYRLFRPLKLFLKKEAFREIRRSKNGSVRFLRLAVRRVLEEGHRRPPRAIAHSCD